MEQRSEALRLASIRKKNQINEVQTAKDIQMKQQQDRIQKELIKSQKQEEAALQGLEKLRLKRIERKSLSKAQVCAEKSILKLCFSEAKEKHEYERQRAQQNLEKSKQEFEQEQALLEESINKKTARAELIKRERERVSLTNFVDDRRLLRNNYNLKYIFRRFYFQNREQKKLVQSVNF